MDLEVVACEWSLFFFLFVFAHLQLPYTSWLDGEWGIQFYECFKRSPITLRRMETDKGTWRPTTRNSFGMDHTLQNPARALTCRAYQNYH